MQMAYYYNFRSWFLNDSVRRPYLPRTAFFLPLTYNLPSDVLRRDTGDIYPKLPLYAIVRRYEKMLACYPSKREWRAPDLCNGGY